MNSVNEPNHSVRQRFYCLLSKNIIFKALEGFFN